MEVDLAQGQHAVLGSVALIAGSGAIGGERRDVDALDLLGVVGGQSVDFLLLVELATLELRRGAIGVGDHGLHGVDGTVGVLAVQDLDVAQDHRLPELEVHSRRELDVLGQLAVLMVVVEVPFELEVVVLLIVVEEAVVLLALDELLNVGALVGREDVVRHGDVERLLSDLLELLLRLLALNVVEVDLADGEHAVVRVLDAGGNTRGGQRLDLDLGDLLGLVGVGDDEVVHRLVRGEVVALELLRGAVREGDDRLKAVDGAVGGLGTVVELDVLERARLLELEGEVRGQADLLIEGLGVQEPLELELAIVVLVVEQASVAVLLNELLDVVAIVRGVALVGDADVERVLLELHDLRSRIGVGGDEVLLGADEPSLAVELDLAVLLGLELKRHNVLGTLPKLLVALVGKRDVHGVGRLTKGVHAGVVLHALRAVGGLEAVAHELEVIDRVLDQRAHGVDVLGVGRLDGNLDGLASLDGSLLRDDRDGAGDLAVLLGAAVELGHGEGHVVHVVGVVHVVVRVGLGNMGVPIRRAGAAVLATIAVREMVLVLGANRAGSLEGAGIAALGLIDLVERELGGGEEATRGLLNGEAQVASRLALEVNGLGQHLALALVVPLLDAQVDPVSAVEADLDLHLGNVAVAAVVLARGVNELVQVVGLAVVDGHRHADGLVAVGGVERAAALVVMVEREVQLAPLLAALPVDADRLGCVAPRILEGLDLEGLAPLGEAGGGASADLELELGVVGQVGHVELGGLAARDVVDHAVDQDVVRAGALNLVPGELDARGGQAVLGGGQVRRSFEVLVERVARQLALVLKAGNLERLLVLVHVGLGELDVQPGRGVDRGLGEALVADGLSVGGGAVVEVRGLLEEVDRLALGGSGVLEGLERVDLLDGELLLAVLGHNGRGLLGHVHREDGGAVGVVVLVGALGLAGGEGGLAVLDLGRELGLHVLAVVDVVLFAVLGVGGVGLVLDVGAGVLKQGVLALAGRGEELDLALGTVDGVGVVVGLVHRDDGVGLDEQRELPQRSVEVVEDLAAAVLVAGEVVDPDVALVARQVNAVADIVTVADAAVGLIAVGVLVHGCDQEGVTKGVLVLGLGALSVLRVVVQQDGANHWQAGVAVARVDVGCGGSGGVDVRQELRLQLEVHTGDAGVGVAVRLRGLDVGAPAVHVEHERGEGLPLVIAGGDDGLATEDAVHVGAGVGVTGEGLADERRDVEADVLPVAAGLVAGPDARKALGARPAVEGDDVRTEVDVLGDDVVGGLNTVKRHGVAMADPCDVGLEGGHATGADLGLEVAEELPLRVGVGIRGELGLGPQAGSNTLAVGVVSELLEVLHVRGDCGEALGRAIALLVNAAGLAKAVRAVARAVAVVGQEVAERHVVLKVVIQTGLSRELLGEVSACGDVRAVVGRAMAVQRLHVGVGLHGGAGAALLVLNLAGAGLSGLAALDLPLAVAALGLGGPHVAVPRVQVANVESVLGQEHRVAGDLEVVLEQVLGDRRGGLALLGIRHEIVRVELVLVVLGDGLLAIGRAEVVLAVGERVAHNAVAVIGPVERVRGGNAAVDPVALVGDVDGVARVDEAAVLGAAAKEVLARVLLERLDGAGLVKVERGALLHNDLAAALDGHEGGVLSELDGGLTGGDDDLAVGLGHLGAGLAVLARRVRLGLDLRLVGIALGLGILAELAARIDVVAEDVVFQERDLALDVGSTAIERDRDHIALGLGVLHARQRRRRCRRCEREREGCRCDNRRAADPIAPQNRILMHVRPLPFESGLPQLLVCTSRPFHPT